MEIDTWRRPNGRWSWVVFHPDGYILKEGMKTYRWSWIARLAYYLLGWEED